MRKKENYKKDVPVIHDWFLTNVPKMIQELKENLDDYPPYFLNDYYHRNVEPLGVCTIDEFYDSFGTPESKRFFIKAHASCRKRWLHVLHNIEQAFINSKRETCTYINPYKDEYLKAFRENLKKYGMKINEFAGDDYKKIARLYYDEEERIEMFVEHNRKNALRLFTKYFLYL